MVKYCSILILLICSTGLLGQQQLDQLLLSNFDGTNKKVVISNDRIKSSINLTLGWQKENGPVRSATVVVNPGSTIVDLSSYPDWDGKISILATNRVGFKAELVDRSLMDNFKSLFVEHRIGPTTINFSQEFNLMGQPLRYIMLGIFLTSSLVFFFISKRNIPQSIFAGLLIACLFLYIRSVKTDLDLINQIQVDGAHLAPFQHINTFVETVKPHLTQATWSKEKLSGVHNSFVKYHLAEYAYSPIKKAQKGDLIITSQPKDRKVIVSHRNFYLVKK